MENNNSGFISNQSGFVGDESGFSGNASGFATSSGQANYTETLISGNGAMGDLYCRFYPQQQYREVIKRIKPIHKNDPNFQMLFNQEFANLKKLQHENIVSAKDQGQDVQGLWYTMEYIEGKTLTQLIASREIQNTETKIEILRQVLGALQYVHRSGVIHRDLKPDNIMVANRNRNVKVIDFGLAMSDSFIQKLQLAGSKKYMSPEQKINSSNIDLQSDIYSFGLVMVEFLTGIFALDGNGIQSEQLRNVANKCLKTNKNERYKNCAEILEDLRPKTANLPDEVNRLIDEIVKDGIVTPAEKSYLEAVGKKHNIDPAFLSATLNFRLEKVMPLTARNQQPSAPVAKPQQDNPHCPAPPKNKKTKVKWGAVIAAALLLALIVALIVWLLRKPASEQPAPVQEPEGQEIAEKPQAEQLYDKARNYAYGLEGSTKSPALSLKYIDQALDIEPTNLKYLDAKGEFYAAMGNYYKAKDFWEICKEKDNNYLAQNTLLTQYFSWLEKGEQFENQAKYDDAIKAYQKAADLNNPWGLYHIGEFYSKGLAVQKDLKTAFEYYQKSADCRLAEGELKVGLCYLNGLGTAKDPKVAKNWIRQSADQGNPEAIKLAKQLNIK